MSIVLYHAKLSPPSRSIRILIKHLNLNVEEKEVRLMTGEHLKPKFTKINPFHTVPTLVDDDFALWESRAIMMYLMNKFAPENPIYPTDLKTRAIIDRWLYWDAGTLYPALAAYYGPAFQGGSPPTEAGEAFKEKTKDFDNSLENTKYVAGETLSIADITIAVTITMASAVGIDLTSFKNIERWLQQMEQDLTPPIWKNLVIDPANSIGSFVKSKIATKLLSAYFKVMKFFRK